MFYLYDMRVRIHDERSIMELISSTPLYFDDLIAEPQDPVVLDKQQLLDRLRRLKAAGTMGELRRGVAGLKAEIADPDSRLHVATNDASGVAFMPDYIAAELDQIAASLTIERARYYVERFIKGVTEVRTGAINEINLNRWKEYEDIYTDSLWLVTAAMARVRTAPATGAISSADSAPDDAPLHAQRRLGARSIRWIRHHADRGAAAGPQ